MSSMTRKWIYQRLLQGRTGALVGGRVFSAGSAEASTERPFVVIRRGLREPGVTSSSPTKVENYVIYVHNDPEDAVTIDDGIEAIHFDLGPSAPAHTAEGDISSCQWLDDSEDLADDHYGTNSRNSSWRLVATPR